MIVAACALVTALAVLPGSAGQTQSVTVSGNLVSIVLRWKTANGETRNYSTQTTIVAAQ